jgi:hypothetical protein
VGCVYKSPSSKQENLDELKSLMRNVSQMDKEYSHILIMADFNYHKINWKQWTSSGDKDAEEFLECIYQFEVQPFQDYIYSCLGILQ